VTKLFYYLFLAFLGAVIVHICVLFLIPLYADHPLIKRFENKEASWQFVTLEADHPIIKRLDPSFRLRVCHFDLDEEAVRIIAEGDIPFWSLSLYNHQADNLYSLNNRVMPGESLDLVIGTPIQIMDYKNDNALDAREDSILTQHNIDKGFVVLRAYAPSSDWDLLVENFLTSARCDKISNQPS